jgi:hypothetical protein
VEGSDLHLDLIYNPLGAFLPPEQAALEAKYRTVCCLRISRLLLFARAVGFFLARCVRLLVCCVRLLVCCVRLLVCCVRLLVCCVRLLVCCVRACVHTHLPVDASNDTARTRA